MLRSLVGSEMCIRDRPISIQEISFDSVLQSIKFALLLAYQEFLPQFQVQILIEIVNIANQVYSYTKTHEIADVTVSRRAACFEIEIIKICSKN